MKYFLFILITFTIHAQNVWYVDRDNTSGTYDGRSWATAWRNFDSVWIGNQGVNWSIIQPGDTIYVSGGTDSTVYPGQVAIGKLYPDWLNNPYQFSPRVIIRNAWHESHNGRVYFINRSNSVQRTFDICIGGLDFKDFYFGAHVVYDGGTGGEANVISQVGDSLLFDNCYFINDSCGSALSLAGSGHIVRNSIITNTKNWSTKDQDIFGFGWGGEGGHRIENNIIMQNCMVDSTDAHPDFCQIGGEWGLNEYRETIFLNNFMYQLTPTRKSEYNSGFYISSGPAQHKQRITFINNIMIMQMPDSSYAGTVNSVPAIWLRGESGGPTAVYSLRLYNNTIIYPSANLYLSRGDTLIARNNIFVQWNDIVNNPVLLTNSPYIDSINMDYNFYSVKNWTSGKRFVNYPDYYTLSQWRALGQDIHSDTSSVNPFPFDDVVTEEDSTILSYYTEIGRGAGENLSYLAEQYPEIMYDILGNPRPEEGAWDIGALQWQNSQTSYLNVKVKIFLQGPFSINSMQTSLMQFSLVPNSQPYKSAPWNFSGNEILRLSADQAASVVDWVLVELRNPSNSSQVVSRRAAVLRNDGTLLDTDGSIGVRFNNVKAGTYYIAVKHRNHLAVMSANPVQLTSNSTPYDFTTAMNKAFGLNPMVELVAGKYGMIAGDGNGDGGITIADHNNIWLPQNGSFGYLQGDFNLDSGVTIHDVNLYWNLNNGKMTQVP